MFDHCQCATSLTNPMALRAWNHVVRGVLAHNSQTPTHLGDLLELAPNFALGYAAKGLFLLMMGRRELTTAAQLALSEAQRAAAASPPTARESGWCRALESWLHGDIKAAIAEMEKILRHAPNDTLSMKMSHGIRFILGDARGMRQSIEAVLDAHDNDHPYKGFALGCHAFALEETGAYKEARDAGLQGLQLAPDDAWGLHAVAHVHDMTHAPRAGLELISQNAPAWSHCNNFRYHMWWHKALLHLDLGETDEVFRLYDQKIRCEKTDDYRDISNATSLLIRLELDGIPVGDRWQELADLCEPRTQDGCLVFADLHYMLALTGDGRSAAAQSLLAQARNTGESHHHIGQVYAHPGLCAAEGLAAFGQGQYARAFRLLADARPNMQTIGGSHAQRDVFERLTIDAGLRAGAWDQTEAILQDRTKLRANRMDQFANRATAQLEAGRADAHRVPAQ